MTRQTRFPSPIVKSVLNTIGPLNLKATRKAGLRLSTPELEAALDRHLTGLSLAGFPLRTRSGVVKAGVMDALGYEAPASLKRRPEGDLPAQDLDVYVQKSNNLQVWNAKLVAGRRYALVQVDAHDCVSQVRVVEGTEVAAWNRTGTLTAKRQARLGIVLDPRAPLHVCGTDSERLRPWCSSYARATGALPAQPPTPGNVLPLPLLGERLGELIGSRLAYGSAVSERTRSRRLLARVAKHLGYTETRGGGGCPNLAHEMLEVKLQLSSTIDLGSAWPESDSPLGLPGQARGLRRRDVRYAVFYAKPRGDLLVLTELVLVSGARFFDVFEPAEGRGRNTKLQTRIPAETFRVPFPPR